MRTKTLEMKVEWGSFGSIGIGSHMESNWLVEKITFVSMDENGIKIIADCIHVDE